MHDKKNIISACNHKTKRFVHNIRAGLLIKSIKNDAVCTSVNSKKKVMNLGDKNNANKGNMKKTLT